MFQQNQQANSVDPHSQNIQGPAIGYTGQEFQGMVWNEWAMGGGEWVRPKTVRLAESDVERIAAAVVRMLKADGLVK